MKVLCLLLLSSVALAQPRDKCEGFLVPGQPADFKKASPNGEEILPGTISYASPLGLSVWPTRDFADWNALQKFVNWNSVPKIKELLSHLHQGLPIPSISPQAVRLPLGTESHDLLWAGRILLREGLIRHLWPPPSEEYTFWLAAFPELVPFIAEFRDWPYAIHEFPLRANTSQLIAEIGPLNANEDSLSFELKHQFQNLDKNEPEEVAFLKLKYSTPLTNAPADRARAQAQIDRDWAQFSARRPPPQLVQSQVRGVFEITPSDGREAHALLAFFFFLTRQYEFQN